MTHSPAVAPVAQAARPLLVTLSIASVSLLALIPFLSTATAAPDPTPVASPDGPKIDAIEPTIDVGELLWGSVRTVDFPIENRGNAPLILEKVLPGCGCLTVESFDEEIAAGERGNVKLRLDTGKLLSGKNEKSTLLKTNDSSQPPVKITTLFDVKPLFDLPPLPIELRTLPEQAKSMTFDLPAVTTPAAEVVRVETVHGVGTAKLERVNGIPRVTVAVPATARVGILPENLRMYLKHPEVQNGAEFTCEIAFGVVFQDQIEQSSASITFRRSELQKHKGADPLKKTLTLRTSIEGHKFKILETRLEMRKSRGQDAEAPPPFEINVEEVEPGRHYDIHVTLPEIKVGSPTARGMLYITTDDKYRAERKAPVIAQFPRK